MGNIEDALKDLVLDRYRSIREFTTTINMPYSTMDSIFKRGIHKANMDNIIKICDALEISADALAKGKIISTRPITLAAHLDTDDLTKDELEDVANYIDFIRNKRKPH